MDTYLSLAAIAISLISAIVAALSYRASRVAGREAYAGARAAFGWNVRAKQIFAAPHRPWTATNISVSAYELREELRRSLRDLAPSDRAAGAELLTATIRFLDDIFEWRDDDETPIQEVEQANEIYLRWIDTMTDLLTRLDRQG